MSEGNWNGSRTQRVPEGGGPGRAAAPGGSRRGVHSPPSARQYLCRGADQRALAVRQRAWGAARGRPPAARAARDPPTSSCSKARLSMSPGSDGRFENSSSGSSGSTMALRALLEGRRASPARTMLMCEYGGRVCGRSPQADAPTSAAKPRHATPAEAPAPGSCGGLKPRPRAQTPSIPAAAAAPGRSISRAGANRAYRVQ